MANQVKMATLAAGTRFEVSYDDGVYFERVPGLTAIGDVGEMSDTQETTTLEDTVRTYIPALATPANKQFVGNHLPSDAAQARFVQAGRDRRSVVIKITLPTKPKTVGVNSVALLGFQLNAPTAEGVLQFTIGAQASGKTIWGNDIDVDITEMRLSALSSTVAVGGKLNLALAITPEDATIATNQIVYESVNPTVATVNAQTGEVTGVLPGTFSIRATDSYNGATTLFFGRCVAAGAVPTIAAKTGLVATVGAGKTFAFADMFTATNSSATDYVLTNDPVKGGVTVNATSVSIASTLGAGTVVIKATHKTDSTKTATATITIS